MIIKSESISPYIIEFKEGFYCVQRESQGVRAGQEVTVLVEPKYFSKIENCIKYIIVQKSGLSFGEKEVIELREYYKKFAELKNRVLEDASLRI